MCITTVIGLTINISGSSNGIATSANLTIPLTRTSTHTVRAFDAPTLNAYSERTKRFVWFVLRSTAAPIAMPSQTTATAFQTGLCAASPRSSIGVAGVAAFWGFLATSGWYTR